MRRPGLFVAIGQPTDSAQMLSWQPGSITCYADDLAANNVFNYKAVYPEVSINVRFRHLLNWRQNIEASAKELGQTIIAAWPQLKSLDPYVYFANRLNLHYANGDPNPAHQPDYTTPEFYQTCARWLRLTADIVKQSVPAIKLVTPPFAFGFNEDGSSDDQGRPQKGWAGYDFLQETVSSHFNNIVAFQGYWGYPALGSVPDWLYRPSLASWYAFRWQRLLQLFQARYNLKVRVIIDEAGSFGPADPDFVDQLIYYGQQCLSDDRVISLNYALWQNAANDPLYRLTGWVEHVPDLDALLARLKELPDPPTQAASLESAESEALEPPNAPPIAPPSQLAPSAPDDIFADPFAGSLEGILEAPFTLEDGEPETSLPVEQPASGERMIRVLFEDGHVETMPLEEYLRAVVPAEMPANWPREALKAQAVACRSYAQYAVEHPKFPNADICTTTRCQSYNPDRIRDKSDRAIQETAGQVVLFEGKPANALFSANCGGQTRNNEDVWAGRPLTYLRGTSCPVSGQRDGHGVGFCQHGARELARRGQDYRAILRHYFQKVTVGPIP